MQLPKFIIILLPSFASVPPINCSLSMGLADNGTINFSSIIRTQQPHITGIHQQAYGRGSHHLDSDYAQKCYGESSPNTHASAENRTVSWDEPRMDDDGGKKCCSSLAEVRQGIDAVDEQLLLLLAKRAAYVREATRFKATRDTVDVPSRDRQVMEQALEGAVRYRLPQVIAKGVFSAIFNASITFELCVVSNLDIDHYMATLIRALHVHLESGDILVVLASTAR